MSYIHLKSLSAFSIKGKDVRKFLQGQLTCDVNLLTPTKSLRAAHCNKEGRVTALYQLLEIDDAIVLITQRVLLAEAMKTLAHYGMFSKLTWQDLSVSHKVYANDQGELMLTHAEQVIEASDDEQFFYYQQILKKQAFLTPATVGKFLPQELALSDEALSFTKGCYLGQEIIARLHYLGKLKKSLKVIKSTEQLMPLEELFSEEQSVGSVVIATEYQGFWYGLALIDNNCIAKAYTKRGSSCEVFTWR
jgi:folate-binding protein YgfZ